jgi:GT2 family glycosyltransferase
MMVSVIVCTRNGRERIGDCLEACIGMSGGDFEIIVVDDGSVDGTADHVAARFPEVRLLRLDACGLSAARNAGAEAARGEILAFTDDDCEPDVEWLSRLRKGFRDGSFAAAGGPNLPPAPQSWEEAVVCAAPGAPSHVMLDDVEAEHLPGCNLAVRKSAFMEIGGFDPVFRTAGDDVDFCWRLRDAGHRLIFVPGAFVWHRRRPSIRAFLKQQIGYGSAERILMGKHPHRFSSKGGAIWHGFVYGGGPLRATSGSVIYHGLMGTAGYQSVVGHIQRQRGLIGKFDTPLFRTALEAVNFIQPRLRAWVRSRTWRIEGSHPVVNPTEETVEFQITSTSGLDRLHFIGLLLEDGWRPCGENAEWDLEKAGSRVLLATERGGTLVTRTLVRVSGDHSSDANRCRMALEIRSRGTSSNHDFIHFRNTT